MNFLPFAGSAPAGATSVAFGGATLEVPALREGADGALVFGIRPERIRLNDDGAYRARVIATEYLGTTQIVTLDSPNGELKARIGSEQAARVGESVGLDFVASTVTLFDEKSGRALRSELNEGVLGHG